MPTLVDIEVALDAVTGAATCLVALYFLRIWLGTRREQPLLFCLGLLLTGLGFATVAASHYDLGRNPDLWDQLRLAGQLGGPLVVLFAYVAREGTGWPRFLLVVSSAYFILAVVFAVLFFIVPPAGTFPSVEWTFLPAHAAMTALWSACALLAYRRSREARAGALVPLGFVAFALGKYTWFLADLSQDQTIVLLVYPWRVLAIALLLAAIGFPTPKEEAPELAEA
jgi:hypothetical protein